MLQQSAAIGVDQHMEAIMDVSGKVGLGTADSWTSLWVDGVRMGHLGDPDFSYPTNTTMNRIGMICKSPLGWYVVIHPTTPEFIHHEAGNSVSAARILTTHGHARRQQSKAWRRCWTRSRSRASQCGSIPKDPKSRGFPSRGSPKWSKWMVYFMEIPSRSGWWLGVQLWLRKPHKWCINMVNKGLDTCPSDLKLISVLWNHQNT